MLRQAPPEGVSLRELGERVREGFGDADLPWLRSVVESLGKDGLAEISADEERSAEPAQAHALVGLPEH